jgi:hypothetical protein
MLDRGAVLGTGSNASAAADNAGQEFGSGTLRQNAGNVPSA